MATPFPSWIRRSWSTGAGFDDTHGVLEDLGLHTVCQSARCPNRAECWQRRTATFMVLGAVCTRKCRFCSVAPGSPGPVDRLEPERVGTAVGRLGLRHAVVTSVTRDDLPDGGAAHFAATIRAIRELNAGVTVEVLVPDFQGDAATIRCVTDAAPEVFGHNIETVARLHPELRDRRYSYRRSLNVLRQAHEAGPDAMTVKSALMVGHGETEHEVKDTLEDLLATGCSAVSIGQYLRPSRQARAVAEFVTPERFKGYEGLAYELGFAYAIAGPFVRSSYRAEDMLISQ